MRDLPQALPSLYNMRFIVAPTQQSEMKPRLKRMPRL